MDHVGASLKRKLGPLPVWAWALIGGVSLYVYRNRNGGGGPLGTSSTTSDGSSTGTLSSGAAGGGLGDNSALERELSTLEQKVSRQAGTIAKLRKRLRSKGKKKHPRPHHHKPHRDAQGKTAKKAATRTKTHVPASARAPRRDRMTFSRAHRPIELVKQRGHGPGAGLATLSMPEPSSRAHGRAGGSEHGLGARTHFGGYGSASDRRHRPEQPPAPGRSTRHRPVGGGSAHTLEREAPPPPARSSTRAPAPRHTAPAQAQGRRR